MMLETIVGMLIVLVIIAVSLLIGVWGSMTLI